MGKLPKHADKRGYSEYASVNLKGVELMKNVLRKSHTTACLALYVIASVDKFGRVVGKTSRFANDLGFCTRAVNMAIKDLGGIGFIERYENKNTGEVGLKVNPQFMHRGSAQALVSKLHREIGNGWVETPSAAIDISPVIQLHAGNCYVEEFNSGQQE